MFRDREEVKDYERRRRFVNDFGRARSKIGLPLYQRSDRSLRGLNRAVAQGELARTLRGRTLKPRIENL